MQEGAGGCGLLSILSVRARSLSLLSPHTAKYAFEVEVKGEKKVRTTAPAPHHTTRKAVKHCSIDHSPLTFGSVQFENLSGLYFAKRTMKQQKIKEMVPTATPNSSAAPFMTATPANALAVSFRPTAADDEISTTSEQKMMMSILGKTPSPSVPETPPKAGPVRLPPPIFAGTI